MRILLIKPSTRRLYGNMYRSAILEPLGLEYIASVLLKKNYDVKILDLEAEQIDDKNLVRILKKDPFDVIGFTMPTPLIREVKHLINVIKSGLPDTTFIVGGPHPSSLPEHSLNYTGADISIVGEGEETVVELMQTLDSEKSLDKVRGICFKNNGEKTTTEPRPLIDDLDKIPFPARNLLRREQYWHVYTSKKKDEFYGSIMSTRGCPNQCIFCSSKRIFGSKFRMRSVGNVCDEIEEMIQRFKIKWIYFLDDCFTLNMNRAADICREIIERKLKFKWFAETRVNTVNLELLRLMRKAGCEMITYGIESGDPRVLKVIRKGITVEQVKIAFKNSHKVGIRTRANFMIGHPTETREEILQTITLAKQIKPYDSGFYITLPIPGSKLYEMSLEQGVLEEDDYENLMWYGEPKTTLANVSLRELKELQKRAYREFYLRPSFIINKLLNIRSVDELVNLIKGARPLFSIIGSK